MTLPWQQAIEQKLMLAFEGKRPPQQILTLLAQRQICGFTFFRPYNYQTPAQLRQLTGDLQRAAAEAGHPPLLIAADQEGGQLNALGEGTTQFAGNMALGAARSSELAQKVGQALGKELLALGVNVNYAPVCDVNTNPANPGLGIRAFSDDPALTAGLAAALVRGLQSAGVAATLKHFPGSGESSVDSHHQLPLIEHSRERLEMVELPPFKAAIEAGARMIMSGHFAIPALAGNAALPATLSRAVMHDFVRDELGFDGVMITDALDMGAITQGAGQVIDVVAAMRAGVDLMLLTADWEAQERMDAGLKQAYTRGLIRDEHIYPSLERIAALKAWLSGFEQPELDVVGCAEHQALAQELAERSITLVRDEAGLLPLNLPENARLAVIMPRPADLTPADTSSYLSPGLADAIRPYHPNLDEFVTAHSPGEAEVAALQAQFADYDLIIVGTINAFTNPAQAELVKALLSTGVPAVAAALRTPYDLAVYPEAQTYLCTYSLHSQSLEALAAALWGRLPLQGKLPAQIPGLYPRGHGIESRKVR